METDNEEHAAAMSVLVVEDEGLIAMDLKRRLESFGYSVPAIGKTADDAVRLTASHIPDLILMDIRLKGNRDGIQAAGEVREKFDIPIIFVTAHADSETLDRAKVTQPSGYIVKPFGTADLRAQIEMAHYKHVAERKLRKSEAWFSSTLRSIGEAVITTDANGRVEYMNPTAERLTGWTASEAKGKPVLEVFCIVDSEATCAANPVLAVLNPPAENPVSGEYELYGRAGSVSIIETLFSVNVIDDGVLGAIVAFRDVTSQRDLERRVRQNARMEAVAVMAGALAHDFNNLLTIVLGYADLIQSDPLRKCDEVERIRDAGDLAAKLSRKLLTVSRNEVARSAVFDLNAVIVSGLKVIQHVLGPACSLVFDACPTPLPIRADRAQLQQVLVNFAKNARDAMPSGGKLTIVTSSRSGLTALEIQDTGAGMDAETRERIFEPFFTRKGHKGTGLGMSIVHSIVSQWGGTIDVKSELGHGTAFTILLPTAVFEPETATPANGQEASSQPASGTVLLVEDNEDIRHLLQNQFEQAGFDVLQAGSGEDALFLMQSHGTPVDLLITDVMMPKMNGPELARRCVAQSAEMRVIFISGYSAEALKDDDFLISGRAEFVQKPVIARDLVARARAIIEHPADY